MVRDSRLADGCVGDEVARAHRPPNDSWRSMRSLIGSAAACSISTSGSCRLGHLDAYINSDLYWQLSIQQPQHRSAEMAEQIHELVRDRYAQSALAVHG